MPTALERPIAPSDITRTSSIPKGERIAQDLRALATIAETSPEMADLIAAHWTYGQAQAETLHPDRPAQSAFEHASAMLETALATTPIERRWDTHAVDIWPLTALSIELVMAHDKTVEAVA